MPPVRLGNYNFKKNYELNMENKLQANYLDDKEKRGVGSRGKENNNTGVTVGQ